MVGDTQRSHVYPQSRTTVCAATAVWTKDIDYDSLITVPDATADQQCWSGAGLVTYEVRAAARGTAIMQHPRHHEFT